MGLFLALFDCLGETAAGADEDAAGVVHPFCESVRWLRIFARIRVCEEFALAAFADPGRSVVIEVVEFDHSAWSPAFRRNLCRD